ncbi:MAG: Rne/Rng family ribonuclease [Phycisphaerales bacterium]|nr:Rne/Rng family ribonuclease [Phycisphaerales bacterium]
MKEFVINAGPLETRIALLEDKRLAELVIERQESRSVVGNVYKGRVDSIVPGIQAAFIDFGLERNGFLHISDLHPMYFPGDHREEVETVGLKTPRRDRPPMQKCLRRGQEILVQVLKEGIGTKGPTLTSYLSIPGRYLVMMPYMERLGVSRKIEDDDARRESRKILQELNPPEGFGFIIRTAGIGKPKTELKRDLAYLVRLWKTLEKRMKNVGQIGELYTESDLLIRTLRDVFTSDIGRIIVDEVSAAHRAHDFLSVVSPRSSSQVYLYKDAVPLFHRFEIEHQIESINSREVALPSGGSLVIDQAEAMVAIDVNSGKSRENRDAETTAYKTDIEACDEVCRQLKLRDLGGVVVIDMIDMHQAKHRRDVETRFRNNLKNDRARTQVLPLSRFGILEMTRQRMRPSLTKSNFTPCPHCQGQGQVKTPETVVLEVSRRLAMAMHRSEVARIELTVSPDVAFQLLNRKRAQLVAMEQRYNKPVMVRVSGGGGIDYIEISCFDARNVPVTIDNTGKLPEMELEQIQGGVELLAETEALEQELNADQESAQAVQDVDTRAPMLRSSESALSNEMEPLATGLPQQDDAQSIGSLPSNDDDEMDDDETTIAPPSRLTSSPRPASGKQSAVQPPPTTTDQVPIPGKSRRGRRGRGGRGRQDGTKSAEPLMPQNDSPSPAEREPIVDTRNLQTRTPAVASEQAQPRIVSGTSSFSDNSSFFNSAENIKRAEVKVNIAGSMPVAGNVAGNVPANITPPITTEQTPKPVTGGWRRKRGTQGTGLVYPRVASPARPHVAAVHSNPHAASTPAPAIVPAVSAKPPVPNTVAPARPVASHQHAAPPRPTTPPQRPLPRQPGNQSNQQPSSSPQQRSQQRPPQTNIQRPAGNQPRPNMPQRQLPQRQGQPQRPQQSRPNNPPRSTPMPQTGTVNRTPQAPAGNPSRGYKNVAVKNPDKPQPQ